MEQQQLFLIIIFEILMFIVIQYSVTKGTCFFLHPFHLNYNLLQTHLKFLNVKFHDISNIYQSVIMLWCQQSLGGSSFKSLIDLNTNVCWSWSDVFKNEIDLKAW
jgi:hypothetical protein